MSDERPTFGSLFAGIGGIDLGLERAGWRGRWQVEYEPFCQRVLAKHWPDVQRYGDIHDVDWSSVEPVDLVAGGFPCQPFSVAGQRRGMDDNRWLWPEFERCVRALRPRYVLVENVPGLLVGRGMDAVLGGLADLGYDAEWESIPAAAVGAPHLRYRVWIVAYAQRSSGGQRLDTTKVWGWSGAPEQAGVGGSGSGDVAYARGLGQGWSPALGQPSLAGARSQGAGAEPNGPGHRADVADSDREFRRVQPVGFSGSSRATVAGDDGATRSLADANDVGGLGFGGVLDGLGAAFGSDPDGRGSEGLADAAGAGWRPAWDADTGEAAGGRAFGRPERSGWWATEPDVGRVAHGVPARVDRLRSLGNAVVPQVVEFIGRRILEAEALT